MDKTELESQSIEDLLELYMNHFGHPFPIELCRLVDGTVIKSIVIERLVENKVWKPTENTSSQSTDHQSPTQ